MLQVVLQAIARACVEPAVQVLTMVQVWWTTSEAAGLDVSGLSRWFPMSARRTGRASKPITLSPTRPVRSTDDFPEYSGD